MRTTVGPVYALSSATVNRYNIDSIDQIAGGTVLLIRCLGASANSTSKVKQV